ncbi:prepilin-type N-terminal cleavage/methylation domain-containing protein [Trichococcus patagoniensis]|uniref:Prepilin-type N-terminal cleavage/methylation domain-containing protein n=1 Tax=Trichococcus patagoniensis TaxID=382641 RepID=A0A2T5IQA9_9LACT|nr:prepilin-type N-terminal cleavage/methylation domain-containing protein [Trichococcus patagoniensis]PTQ85999.1 prepilin-type N-terminal cleavage/methylation domain-containing protein [Trichococcus patagoniensis]
MHKWKRGCHFIQQKSSKINLRNESGMTLIELLASIALLSVVLSLVGAVHLFGQKQYLTQSYSARQSNDFAYTLSAISREVRSTPFASITVSESGDTLLIDGAVAFSQRGAQLLKNENQIMADDVQEFLVTRDPATESIGILLKSMSEMNSQPKEYQTTIYFRR